jgi:hypothetical protein
MARLSRRSLSRRRPAGGGLRQGDPPGSVRAADPGRATGVLRLPVRLGGRHGRSRGRPGPRAGAQPAAALGAGACDPPRRPVRLPDRAHLLALDARRPVGRRAGQLRLLRQPGRAHAGRGFLAGPAAACAGDRPGVGRKARASAGSGLEPGFAPDRSRRARCPGGRYLRLVRPRPAARRSGDAAATGDGAVAGLRRHRRRKDLPRHARSRARQRQPLGRPGRYPRRRLRRSGADAQSLCRERPATRSRGARRLHPGRADGAFLAPRTGIRFARSAGGRVAPALSSPPADLLRRRGPSGVPAEIASAAGPTP